jgi:hypothetical protein
MKNVLISYQAIKCDTLQLSDFHTNHRNLKFTMKSILRDFMKKEIKRGSVVRVYLVKQSKAGRNKKGKKTIPNVQGGRDNRETQKGSPSFKCFYAL